jgi:ceramide glucosyltransferase
MLESPLVFWLCLLLWTCSFLWLVGTVAAALLQPLRRGGTLAGTATVAVSIVVPTRARETPRSARERDRTVASLLRLSHPSYELLVCVDRGDPGNGLVDRLTADYGPGSVRVAVSTTSETPNPKVDAMILGVGLARHDVVAFSDDDVEVDTDHLGRMAAQLDDRTGLVSAAAIGTEPTNFGGELELAFMNGQFARLHLAGDFLGFSGALGKALMLRRMDLPRIGGLAATGTDCCEDAALSRNVKAKGLGVALSDRPVRQPVGDLDFSAVWQRHCRWLSCRRKYVTPGFVAEALFSAALAAVAAGIVTQCLGWGAALGVLVTLALWAIADTCLSRLKGWHWRPLSLLAWLVREAIFLPMWFAALFTRTVSR